jgi:hypothetical protein
MLNRSLNTNNQSLALVAFAAVTFVALGGNGSRYSDQEWSKMLAYKKLSRASNSGSVSTKTNFYFCPSGEYAMQTQFSGFSGGGAGTLSMADEDVELGRWVEKNGTLYLQAENGERREYDLAVADGGDVIRLNGQGYLVDTQNECGR